MRSWADPTALNLHWTGKISGQCSRISSQSRKDRKEHKLKLFINFVSHSIYQLIADCLDYEDAIVTMHNTFVKPKDKVFARHCLATRKQQARESIDIFIQALRQPGKDCDFYAVSAEINRDDCIRGRIYRRIELPNYPPMAAGKH